MQADNEKIKRKLNIARGQLEGVIKMIDNDRYCIDVSNQIMAIISLLKNVNKDVLTAHLHSCVETALESDDEALISQKLDEIADVINQLSK